MWNEIFKRWIDLLFWWVPKDEAKPPEEAKERAPSATEQSAGREPEVVQQVVSDDLTVIKGIGPAIQEKLGAGDCDVQRPREGGPEGVDGAAQGGAADLGGAGPRLDRGGASTDESLSAANEFRPVSADPEDRG
jgi:hypothetical protein